MRDPPAKAGDIRDVGSINGLGRSPGEGDGNLLQYSCLGNPMNGVAWWAPVHGVTKASDPTQQLNNNNSGSGLWLACGILLPLLWFQGPTSDCCQKLLALSAVTALLFR